MKMSRGGGSKLIVEIRHNFFNFVIFGKFRFNFGKRYTP